MFLLVFTICMSSVSLAFATEHGKNQNEFKISNKVDNSSSSYLDFDYVKSESKKETEPEEENKKQLETETIPVVGAPSPGGNFTGWLFSNNVWYYFINDVLQTGWIWSDSAWYYLDSTGAMQIGWLFEAGKWYYLNPSGDMQRGWAFVDNEWYFMDQSGVMQTGWLDDASQRYYLFSNGVMAKSWQFIISEWYLFAGSGAMQTGWKFINNEWYFMNQNGVMSRGFETIGNDKYYFTSSGNMCVGWLNLEGKQYYFTENGVMATGWKVIDGRNCYFDNNGVYDSSKSDSLKNGWVTENEETYFYVDGVVQKGWFWDGTSWYYFDKDSGARKYGWVKDEEVWYYLGKDGRMHTGWLFIEEENNWYYLDASGKMCTGIINVDGKWYIMDTNGVYISEASDHMNDPASPDNPTKGIDISTWQGDNINWSAVKDSGIEYVIIRSNFGWTGVDKRFKQNIEGAHSVGLRIGVYLYSYATTPAEAVMEFENFKRTVEPYRNMINYPVAYDLEDNNAQGGLSVDQLTDIAVTFCDLVKNDGYQPMIYASVSWMERKLDYNRIKDYNLWVAQYYDICQYEHFNNMWQYSSRGSVSGIDGNVDMNLCYGLRKMSF